MTPFAPDTTTTSEPTTVNVFASAFPKVANSVQRISLDKRVIRHGALDGTNDAVVAIQFTPPRAFNEPTYGNRTRRNDETDYDTRAPDGSSLVHRSTAATRTT